MDKAQTEKPPILPQSPLQQMIGAMADTANTGGTEKKADRQQPGPRSSESWREELDRWLNDSTNLQRKHLYFFAHLRCMVV